MTHKGIRIVGLPISTRDYQRRYISDLVRKEPAALVSVLAPSEGTQARHQILHLSATSKLPFLLKILLPEVTRQIAEEYNTLIEWGLASTIAGERAVEMGLAARDEVCEVLEEGIH